MKTLYRNIIQFEIISEEPIHSTSLQEVIDETIEGNWSGLMLDRVIENQEIQGKEAVKIIQNQGTDLEFFGIDDEGEEVED